MSFCGECGENLSDLPEARFCGGCGAAIETQPQEEQQQSTAAAAAAVGGGGGASAAGVGPSKPPAAAEKPPAAGKAAPAAPRRFAVAESTHEERLMRRYGSAAAAQGTPEIKNAPRDSTPGKYEAFLENTLRARVKAHPQLEDEALLKFRWRNYTPMQLRVMRRRMKDLDEKEPVICLVRKPGIGKLDCAWLEKDIDFMISDEFFVLEEESGGGKPVKIDGREVRVHLI